MRHDRRRFGSGLGTDVPEDAAPDAVHAEPATEEPSALDAILNALSAAVGPSPPPPPEEPQYITMGIMVRQDPPKK